MEGVKIRDLNSKVIRYISLSEYEKVSQFCEIVCDAVYRNGAWYDVFY